MKTEKIEIEGKTYVINELKYCQVSEFSQNVKEASKQIMIASTGMTEEEYMNLSMSDGIKIMKAVNNLNGLSTQDFPTPVQISN